MFDGKTGRLQDLQKKTLKELLVPSPSPGRVHEIKVTLRHPSTWVDEEAPTTDKGFIYVPSFRGKMLVVKPNLVFVTFTDYDF